MFSRLIAALFSISLAGCVSAPTAPVATQAVFPGRTATQAALNEIPPPARPVAVAVYGFADQTGKFATTDTGQTLSRAITQGGGSILVKALQDAGNRKWFTVVEREAFKNLLNERQIISEMRARYLGETNVNPQALPALLFAGVLLEGGIISYDSNTLTGGAGAAVLGLGVSGKYKQDTVTVYLRAVSVKTGEILTTVTTSKTITSKAVQANVFAYVASDKIGETELGYTTNEPGQLALQQAIEKAVYGLVMEGVELKLWSFADTNAGWPLYWRYKQEREGVLSAAEVEKIARKARPKPSTTGIFAPFQPAADVSATGSTRRATPSPGPGQTASGDRPANPPVTRGKAEGPSQSSATQPATAGKGD